MFCCLCKKHIKTGKNVKCATAPGTRYRKAAISEHSNSEEHKQSVRLRRVKRKFDCGKVIFILRGTALMLAQPTWCISSNCHFVTILCRKSNINQVLYQFEKVPYLLC